MIDINHQLQHYQRTPGIPLNFGLAASTYGDTLIAWHDEWLVRLSLCAESPQKAIEELYNAWPEARIQRDDATAEKHLNTALSDQRPMSLLLKGTDFQYRVWAALSKVGYGQSCHYGDIARNIGSPNACRAVGSAVGANPLAIVIPCHRVLPATGGVGHYHWGATIKQQLLAAEGVCI